MHSKELFWVSTGILIMFLSLIDLGLASHFAWPKNGRKFKKALNVGQAYWKYTYINMQYLSFNRGTYLRNLCESNQISRPCDFKGSNFHKITEDLVGLDKINNYSQIRPRRAQNNALNPSLCLLHFYLKFIIIILYIATRFCPRL